MTVIFVGLALLLITLVTVLVLVFEKQPGNPPPPAPPPLPATRKRPTVLRRPRATKTNPFGVEQPGAMILSRRVLSNLPLPPPPLPTELDLEGPFGDDVKTLIKPPRHRDEQVIVIEVDD
jgi:hypothetical protein